MVYWQSPVTYYTGRISSTSTGQVTAIPNKSYGWTSVNGTILYDMPNGFTIGVQGQNIFANQRGITPCTASTLKNTPSLGTGCGPFWPAGPGSVQTGVNAPYGGTYGGQYPNENQSSPLFMFFISKRIP